jgi:O-methyltransferase
VSSWLRTALLVLVAGVGAFALGHSAKKCPENVVRYEPFPCSLSPSARVAGPNGLYLDLMKLSLTDLLYETDPAARAAVAEGRNWPARGLTMIGVKRLENIQMLMDKVLTDNTPGDFIEAGAWRGGACIFMRAVLEARGITDRRVWVADSFEGLPVPRSVLPEERSMAVSLEVVQDNFRRYGLLDDQVKFLKGWFKDSLPKAPIGKLAVLRVDADLYESTKEALTLLYDKVSPGGYIIIDDYGYFQPCAKAVEEFRSQRGISAPVIKIDWTGVYWQKAGKDAPGS